MNAQTLRAIVQDASKEIDAALEQVRIAAQQCADANGLRFKGLSIDVDTIEHRDLVTPSSELYLTGVRINVDLGL